MTVANAFETMTALVEGGLGLFTKTIGWIFQNPLILVPIGIAITGSLIFRVRSAI